MALHSSCISMIVTCDFSNSSCHLSHTYMCVQLENLKVQQKRIQDNQQMLHDIRNHDGEEMAQLRNRLENEIQVCSNLGTAIFWHSDTA